MLVCLFDFLFVYRVFRGGLQPPIFKYLFGVALCRRLLLLLSSDVTLVFLGGGLRGPSFNNTLVWPCVVV